MTLWDRLVRLALPAIPRFIVNRIARRYVAGTRLEDALAVVRTLNSLGAMATLDYLGEEVRKPEQVDLVVEEYLRILQAITTERLRCNISLKPTHFGLRLDEARCQCRIAQVAQRGAQLGIFVRLDMEDHTTTDATLRMYRQLQPEYGNLGIVLQSMLRRTPTDISALLAAPLEACRAESEQNVSIAGVSQPATPSTGLEQQPPAATFATHPHNVRLCKGIYREGREVAWQGFDTIRASYIRDLEGLLAGGAYVGIATHDEHLIWAGLDLIHRLQLSTSSYEFQMLLGVEEELRRIILADGHPLRVYVPYGTDWYSYSMRRMRENPTIARHVLKALLLRS